MITAADIFVKALEAQGIEYIFGVPGEENLAFLDSVRRSKIKFVITRHEQAAGFMAATVGRLTGNPGVCLSTLGPGATNLMTAVAYAQLGAMPTLFITGQKPIKYSKQGHFQIINTVEMMRPITKYSKQIVDGRLVASAVSEACRLAVEERPGAVHIELPEDVAGDLVEDNFDIMPVVTPRRPIAEGKAISEAIRMMEAAKCPIILVGAGANRKRVSKMLTSFIEKTKIPFFTTQMGKGVVSEKRKEYLGTAALSNHDNIHDSIAKADLIINIGHDTIEKPPFLMGLGSKQKVIHLNFSPSIPDLIYNPTLEVIGDIANAIWQISEKINPSDEWNFSILVNPITENEKKLSVSNKFSPISIIKEIRQKLNDDDIVTLDNGMYKLWFARHFSTYSPNTILLDNALATMGAGLPSAIAAKILNPDKKVIAVCGDGGFMMSSQELETAKRLGIDLTIILLNNNGFGMISWKQENMKLPSFGLNFDNPDFVKLAESFGVFGYRVDDNNNLKDLLKKSLITKGVHLIEVPIDYSDNKYLGKKI